MNSPAYEDGTDSEFRKSAIKSQTPGNYPKRNKLHLQHGESLKRKKNLAYENLTTKLKEIDPDANKEKVVKKINS